MRSSPRPHHPRTHPITADDGRFSGSRVCKGAANVGAEDTCHPRRHSRWMCFWLPMQTHGEMSGFSSVSSSSKHTCPRGRRIVSSDATAPSRPVIFGFTRHRWRCGPGFIRGLSSPCTASPLHSKNPPCPPCPPAAFGTPRRAPPPRETPRTQHQRYRRSLAFLLAVLSPPVVRQ